MREIEYQLKGLCRRNRDGSYATRHNRQKMLMLIANQLYEMGYRQMQAKSLKPKHVQALVTRWQDEKRSLGVIKNRLSVLRWWAGKIGKPALIAKDNRHYGLGQRHYVSEHSKALTLNTQSLAQIKDLDIRASLELQAAFGLRREEAIKFHPAWADQGDHIRLKGSWTKGGKPRIIPISNTRQRHILDQIKQRVGQGYLIPPDKNYIQQLKRYERETARAGLHKLHGLRHQYAQDRYRQLSGWKAPVQGGLTQKDMTEEQRKKDQAARLQISRELGHEREQITAVYLGR